MEYITIGTLGNSINFGELTASYGSIHGHGTSDGSRGVIVGGTNPTPAYDDHIDYFNISVTSNSADFSGELTAPSNHEIKAIERVGLDDNVRLACQLKPTNNISVQPLLNPQNTLETVRSARALTGKEQETVILFVDLRDFTKLSEGLEPKEVLELLSEYQTKMVAAVFQNGGSVDKFIGDSVMATFGTPVSRGNDAQNALNCIRQMQISMREWEKERSDKDLPVIKHRVGVHYGSCFVGNVGSEDRVEFTVIGDTVNVASRICEACKEVESDVLISEEVKLRLSENLPTEEVKNFEVRGRDKKITLHKLTV